MSWWPFRSRKTEHPQEIAARIRHLGMARDGTRAQKVLADWQQRLANNQPKIRAGSQQAQDAANKLFGSALGIDGVPMSETLFAWYGSQTFIGYQACAILAQHWLIEKVCDMPGKDAVRKGFAVRLKGKDDDAEELVALSEANKRFDIVNQMREFSQLGRTYGIRLAIFRVDSLDPQYYEKPFNPDGVRPGSYRGISQVDPYWCAPELDAAAAGDPASAHFFEPTWWQINGKRYHRSHLAIFRTGILPDFLKPTYLYGGIPVPQQIMERVYGAERTANETPELVMTKRQDVWKTSVEEAVTNQEEFVAHMANYMDLRDNFGVKVIDSDDEMTRMDTTLTDLDKLTMGQYQLVAAAGRVPVTKLIGTAPSGLSATGEYDEASYHEELESLQTVHLNPMLERHILLTLRSEIEPQFKLKAGSLVASIEWAKLDAPTAKELAETNKAKADADNLYVAMGALDGVDVRNRLAADPESGYVGIGDMTTDPEDDPKEEELAPEET